LFLIIFSFFIGLFSSSVIYNKKLKKENEKNLNFLLSNFISYSQHFEDFILFYLLYDIRNGFYIDVGANDPNLFSVTKAFYERGWYGINIEPLPEKYKLLKLYRHRDINLQTAAGEKEGNTSLRLDRFNGLCSSFIYNEKKNNSKILNIKVNNMSNICKKYVPSNIEIQFCKIDVESAEKFVLLGYDFINYRPKIFCIESLIDLKTKIPEYKQWEYILFKNDYAFAYQYKRNRFYYDKRIEGLKDKFNRIDFYIKIYKK
jgi:FkbM family methyltransferase